MSKKLSTRDYKNTVKVALEGNYGFSAKSSDIKIHYGNEYRTLIIFSIRGIIYRFKSYIFHDNSVWCGDGTIEKDNIIKIIVKSTNGNNEVFLTDGKELTDYYDYCKSLNLSFDIYYWNKYEQDFLFGKSVNC